MSEPTLPEDIVQDTLIEAWNLFRKDFVLYLISGLILFMAAMVSFGLLSGPMTVGFVKIVEGRRRGEAKSPTDIFEGFSQFGESLIAFILISIGVFLGGLLFIVPGLIFGLAMSFSFHAIALDHETASGAMKKSFSVIMENLTLSIVFLVIVLVLNGIGAVAVFGTLLTVPYSLVLLTLVYHLLSGPTRSTG